MTLRGDSRVKRVKITHTHATRERERERFIFISPIWNQSTGYVFIHRVDKPRRSITSVAFNSGQRIVNAIYARLLWQMANGIVKVLDTVAWRNISMGSRNVQYLVDEKRLSPCRIPRTRRPKCIAHASMAYDVRLSVSSFTRRDATGPGQKRSAESEKRRDVTRRRRRLGRNEWDISRI